MNNNKEREGWLCRNCNTLVSTEHSKCPNCSAEHPEEIGDDNIPEGITEVKLNDYTKTEAKPKEKYSFRETVLVNIADITLTIGVFAIVAILILPNVVELGISKYTAMMSAICIDIVIFICSITTWALLRTVADISHHLRQKND